MSNSKDESRGDLVERLGAKAVALTAVATLVFLFFPRLRPAEERSASSAVGPESPPHVEAVRLDVSGPPNAAADAIRQVLRRDQETSRTLGQIVRSLQLGSSVFEITNATPQQIAMYILEQRSVAHSVADALSRQVESMRDANQLATTAAFHSAYHAHVAAWERRSGVLHRYARSIDRYLEQLKSVPQEVARMQWLRAQASIRSDDDSAMAAIAETWGAVRTASRDAGVDPAPFETP